jgi:hypothetical protein
MATRSEVFLDLPFIGCHRGLRNKCSGNSGTPRADAGPDVAEGAVESSAAVDRQAAHRGCERHIPTPLAPPR